MRQYWHTFRCSSRVSMSIPIAGKCVKHVGHRKLKHDDHLGQRLWSAYEMLGPGEDYRRFWALVELFFDRRASNGWTGVHSKASYVQSLPLINFVDKERRPHSLKESCWVIIGHGKRQSCRSLLLCIFGELQCTDSAKRIGELQIESKECGKFT